MRRQIESFKAGERVAREKLREMELSFLQSKQKLEAELEDEKAKVGILWTSRHRLQNSEFKCCRYKESWTVSGKKAARLLTRN